MTRSIYFWNMITGLSEAVHIKKSGSCPAGGQHCGQSGGHKSFLFGERIVKTNIQKREKMKKKKFPESPNKPSRPLHRKHNYDYGQQLSMCF